MGVIERKTISNLRRRVGLLLVLIFCLLWWICNLRSDRDWTYLENKQLRLSLFQKNEHITKLYYIIDSLKRQKKVFPEKEKKKQKKINKEIEINTKKIIDTISDTNLTKRTLNTPIDTVSKQKQN